MKKDPTIFAIGRKGFAFPVVQQTSKHVLLDTGEEPHKLVPIGAVRQFVDVGQFARLKGTPLTYQLIRVFQHRFGTLDDGNPDIESWAELRSPAGRICRWKVSQLEFFQ
jgi:hypothetical protein